MLGAKIYGYALAPYTQPNMFEALNLSTRCIHQENDIREYNKIEAVINEFAPEVVFHLAAQPLVRRSYRAPLETLSVNVNGTANVLEACKRCPSVQSIIIVTTDKCYENKEEAIPFTENDRLGGHDIYSASKACAELLTSSYRDAFYSENPIVASARAGNVIGGGDWSEDRLIPDIVRALYSNETLSIRSPDAIRPWQHVLDPLCRYLILAEKLTKNASYYAGAFNFGPSNESLRTVKDVLTAFLSIWQDDNKNRILYEKFDTLHEATILSLDSSKAHKILQWTPLLDFNSTITLTAQWYKTFIDQKSSSAKLYQITEDTINSYMDHS